MLFFFAFSNYAIGLINDRLQGMRGFRFRDSESDKQIDGKKGVLHMIPPDDADNDGDDDAGDDDGDDDELRRLARHKCK